MSIRLVKIPKHKILVWIKQSFDNGCFEAYNNQKELEIKIKKYLKKLEGCE